MGRCRSGCWRTRGIATSGICRPWRIGAWTAAWPRGREGKKAAEADAEAHPAKARMAEKLAGEEGRAQYARRKWLSEAPNGWIKQSMGFRRFSVRGLRKVRGEWALVCLALNIKRMPGLQAA